MKKIEEKYKVLDQISHILLRPQTYVGSNKPSTSIRNIVNGEKIEGVEITHIPSFIKIFDEVVTNSVDEHQRNKNLNKIDVWVDIDSGTLKIRDNGGIPVQIHKEHNQYVPEVIFGNLMSGSNYDDSDERTVAGLNGLGAKLTNVFSTEFIISTSDGKKQFKQVFKNNMRDREKPLVKASKTNFTEIVYKPDLSQFGLEKIDNDHLKMIEKRVYDLAGTNPGIKFSFNGEAIDIKSFEDYIKLYVSDYLYESKKDKTWAVGISPSDKGFQQVSFVNSIELLDGGTVVDYILNQIIIALRDFFMKKHKVDVKPSELKNHMFLFINSTVINPSFSSQTKEKIITEIKDFDTSFELSNKFIQSIIKSEIIDSVLDWVKQKKNAEESKIQRDLNKKLSKIKVEKLIDAKGKDRWNYSIGLFEGDCLHEDTDVRIIREDGIYDIPIRDVKSGDLVITHENRISDVYSVTKKIKKKSIIKTKNCGDIICSREHKFFVYDRESGEFYFESVENIKVDKHRLVKNYLAFTESLLEIDSIDGDDIKLVSGETINTNSDHKFAIYNKEDNIFSMGGIADINPEIHSLVNTFNL
jgi:DNA topoisomerase II